MKTKIELYKRILDNLEEGIYFVDKNRKIIYWNKGAEEITGYSKEEVINRQCHDSILIHINEKGENLCKTKSCPLSKIILEKKPCRRKLYLHHKNGHRVPVFVTTFPVLDNVGKLTGIVEIFRDISHISEIKDELKKFKKLALLDHLTSLWNRRYIEKILYSKIEEFERYNIKFGVLFIDIDDFKKINDVYGHSSGDKILKMVANTLAGNVRTFDVVGRWGGEEFIVLVENVNKKELYTVGEKLRLLVEKSIIFTKNNKIQVTVSVGATLVEKNDTPDKLIKRADELMYKSKKRGKNCVSIK